MYLPIKKSAQYCQPPRIGTLLGGCFVLCFVGGSQHRQWEIPTLDLHSLKQKWPLKNGPWESTFLLGRSILRDYVSFREGTGGSQYLCKQGPKKIKHHIRTQLQLIPTDSAFGWSILNDYQYHTNSPFI